MRKFLGGLQHVLEWLIIIIYVIGGLSLLFADPASAIEGGPVANLFGASAALLFYGLLFNFSAGLLAYAKIRHKKKLHKHALFLLWLVGCFTIFLEFALMGLDVSSLINAIDNIFATLAAGYCWLRWKFLTEYLDPDEFYRQTLEIRDDLPPLP